MYSVGEEFEYELDGVIEDFTCIAHIVLNEKEYIIAENEYDLKKVFLYDIMEEEIEIVDEDEEEYVLESYENGNYEDESDFSYWDGSYDDDDYDYDDTVDDDMEDSFIIEDDEEDEEDEEEVEEKPKRGRKRKSEEIDEDFLLSLFEDE